MIGGNNNMMRKFGIQSVELAFKMSVIKINEDSWLELGDYGRKVMLEGNNIRGWFFTSHWLFDGYQRNSEKFLIFFGDFFFPFFPNKDQSLSKRQE